MEQMAVLKKHKARYVARGFSQKEGIDYDETSATCLLPCTTTLQLYTSYNCTYCVARYCTIDLYNCTRCLYNYMIELYRSVRMYKIHVQLIRRARGFSQTEYELWQGILKFDCGVESRTVVGPSFGVVLILELCSFDEPHH